MGIEFGLYKQVNANEGNGLQTGKGIVWKAADLHLHTNFSDGSAKPEEIVDASIRAGLDAIAITDHDNIESSVLSVDYALRHSLPIEVIPGIEVSTKHGHVIVLNTFSGIPRGMSLVDTILYAHQLGGYIVIPHPNLPRSSSVPFQLISTIINSPDPGLYIDGIEIFNASGARLQQADKTGLVFGREINVRKFIAKNIHNPKIGALLAGSDGHSKHVGYGITAYNSQSVLEAVASKQTFPMKKNTNMLEDLTELIAMTYSVVISHLDGRMEIRHG
ncbi:MAG: PHP domain-containing protein [Patescibacteria group bacterium]|jgi:hypothetical protein